ncbi:MAG: nitrogen fixation protein NifQ [Candidatus Binataceae bacterium]
MQPAIAKPRACDSTVADFLLEHAANQHDPVTLAFAGIISVLWRTDQPMPVPILGLNTNSFTRLASRYFGDAGRMLAARVVCGAPHPADDRRREFVDLSRLLLEYRTTIVEETEWLACAIATGALGENHLWQDLGLPSRKDLSHLLLENFTALSAMNVTDMRWKKFFYKQLCDRAGVNLCKAPSCSECVDYDVCFGPEDHANPAMTPEKTAVPTWLVVSR